MTYTKQNWINDHPSTPLSAERLGHIEDGIEAAEDGWVDAVGDFGADPTGNDDSTTEILNALSEGPVRLRPGQYSTSRLTMPNNAVLRGPSGSGYGWPEYDGGIGEGPLTHKAVIKLIPGANDHLIYGPIAVGHVRLIDLVLDGNKTSQTSGPSTGVYIEDDNDTNGGDEANWILERVYITRFNADGVYHGNWRRGSHFHNVSSFGNTNNGFTLLGSDHILDKCFIGQNNNYGVSLLAGVTRILNCDIFQNLIGLVTESTARYSYVSGCMFNYNQNQAIYLVPELMTISQNQFSTNGLQATDVYAHIQVHPNAARSIICGNTFGLRDSPSQARNSHCVYFEPTAKASLYGNIMEPDAAQVFTNDFTQGMVAISSDGTLYKIAVANDGSVSVTAF